MEETEPQNRETNGLLVGITWGRSYVEHLGRYAVQPVGASEVKMGTVLPVSAPEKRLAWLSGGPKMISGKYRENE